MLKRKHIANVGLFIIFWLISYERVGTGSGSFLLAIGIYLTWQFVLGRDSVKEKRELSKKMREMRLHNEQDLFFEEHRRWNEKMRAREQAADQTRLGE